MNGASSLRTAAAFSIIALALMAAGVATIVLSSGAGAQNPLETFSDPAAFTEILEGAAPALQTALFFDALFAIAYAGAVGFAAIGLRDNCPPAAWVGGLGVMAAMLLDISENLMMLGSLGLAGAAQEITGDRIALHVFVSGMKLHVAAVALVAVTFVLPRHGVVAAFLRWGIRVVMPVSVTLFVTDAFGARGYGALGVFYAMVLGLALLAVVAYAQARRLERMSVS